MITHNCDKLVAVIDIGKSRSKITLANSGGHVVTQVDRANATIDDGPYPHLDVDGTWQWILDSLSATGRAGQVHDCVVVTHGATFALLDGRELATPVMDYEFDGFAEINVDYESSRDGFSATMSPSLPAGLNAGRQIFYIQESMPDVFRRVSSIVPYPQYWASRLCGVVATEVTSLGSHTDLWKPATAEYSALVANRGWTELMPPLHPAWQVLGTVLPEIASQTGLAPDCRIRCGIHDSNASLLRHLDGSDRQFSVVSTGTWVICMAPGHSLGHLRAGWDMLANVDATGQPLPTARFMGGREFRAIVGDVGSGKSTVEAARNVMANNSFAIPCFENSGGPFARHDGELIDPPSDPAERRALASLYCALMTDLCLEYLGACGDVIVEGRYVDDPLFLEALCHFRSGHSLLVSSDATGTLGGALRLIKWPEYLPADSAPYQMQNDSAAYCDYRSRWRDQLPSQNR